MGQILEQPQPPEKHHFSEFYNCGCMKKVFKLSQLLIFSNRPLKTCAKVDLSKALQQVFKNNGLLPEKSTLGAFCKAFLKPSNLIMD